MFNLESLPFFNSYSALPNEFYQFVQPTPVSDLELAHFNHQGAKLINLDNKEARRPEFVQYLSGQKTHGKMNPLAMCYAGHQFGVYVPRLGDGRAILLGEVHIDEGKWDLHLKGAGPTKYSRGGDGRAVLRSTIREYLCSEAMASLGIPSSRSLCLFTSTEAVNREELETAAMMIRMAPSHIRFGNFEYFYYTSQFDHLKTLADYLIEWHYPHLKNTQTAYLDLLYEIMQKTADLIAYWQAYGFVHGVMNTDNMSALGITLDYGPYGFMDDYQPSYNVNHSDHQGRYSFNQQPQIALFNISCLAQAMLPLFSEEPEEAAERAQDIIKLFDGIFWPSYIELMRKKLGLKSLEQDDLPLVQELFDALAKNHVDYALFFRNLSHYPHEVQVRNLFREPEAADSWLLMYEQFLNKQNIDAAERQVKMKAVNPKFILRNYLLQVAIENAKQGDYTEFNNLMLLAQDPYSEHPGYEAYFSQPPKWSKNIELSCSS